MNNNEIRNRIDQLRSFMEIRQLAAFIIPSTDPHAGEYVPEHWESRKWISGFTGSAGTVVITTDNGGLWTDSRYFLQAEEQLSGTGLTLFKERQPETPSIAEWLGSILKAGESIGIDGFVNTTIDYIGLESELTKYGLTLTATEDPFDKIWLDRPLPPRGKPFILPIEYTGESCTNKLNKIKREYSASKSDGILISALDEIAWLLNLRGNDVHCNPVFISYLLITDNDVTLFIDNEKLTQEVKDYLKVNHIDIKPYKNIIQELEAYQGQRLQMSGETNYALFSTAKLHYNVHISPSPVLKFKAIKNDTEISGFHHAMERDGIAMIKFLIWIKEAVKSGKETEMTIDKKLYQLRSEQRYFKGLSFDTIAGYQQHGAIVHYEATDDSAAILKPEGLLLLDSGGQYLDGTTDITRTIVLGPITEEQKTDYTLVLKGMINLAMAQFPHGTCGTQLDVLARLPMWKAGINYGHGTGHGVGHFLNVHEGPHQIRMNNIPAILTPGMTVTDEPGIYRDGKYGIRIENTMIVTPCRESEFGKFYQFEPLTLCPIDKEAINIDMLNEKEREWFNNYHKRVYNELSPLLNKEEKEWLQQATSEI